jgi:ADP-ribosylglycohydrolase
VGKFDACWTACQWGQVTHKTREGSQASVITGYLRQALAQLHVLWAFRRDFQQPVIKKDRESDDIASTLPLRTALELLSM